MPQDSTNDAGAPATQDELGAEGTYTAPEGQEFEVYGFYEEVPDLDGSLVTIERAYEGGPRRQRTLAANERGNLVDSGGAAPAAE